MDIKNIVKNQRAYFKSNKTLSYEFRKESLKKLRRAIYKYQDELFLALEKDLGKSNEESYMTEVGFVLKELTYMEKHLKKLMKPKKVRTGLTDFPASSYRYSDPHGVVLIMSPWNYPVNLTLGPLIGAIAGGNTMVVKPSEYSKNTAIVFEKMLSETYSEEYVKVIRGGRAENQELLNQKFDYIFFTGSTTVGRIVMEKAARYLTPISLELGGKSPSIVCQSANLKVSAKRLIFGKFLNSGQTCIAPDYLFVHKDVKEAFVEELIKAINELYGEDPINSKDFGSIINDKHFNRLLAYFNDGKIITGGQSIEAKRKISPTLLDDVKLTSDVMQEEIFGPILPIIEFESLDEVITFIESRPRPLALYLFTESKEEQNKVITNCRYGGGCVNDTVVHIASEYLPFGGVGESGMGSYHGETSFKTFTHSKSVLKKKTWYDMPFRYAPYSKRKSNIIKKFLK